MDLKFLEDIFKVKKPDPQKVRKQHRKRSFSLNMKTVIVVFAVLVVLLFALSAVVIKSENDKNNQTTAEETEQTSQAALASTGQSLSLRCNLLVGFTKQDNSGLQLLALVSADAVSGQTTIKFIPVQARSTVNNYEGTMREHLENGGITELLWAAGEYCAASIERYLYCDEEDFCEIMKAVGETEITVENRIDHSYNGINFIIEKGRQNLTADMMLKYFVYLCDNITTKKEEIISLFSLLAQKLIDAENADSVSESYAKIINSISTDISAMDISTYLSDILSLVKDMDMETVQ